MRRIMLATDFSERSDRALRRTVALARETGASIDLVHAVDDDRPRQIVERESDDARMLLAELARSLESGDNVRAALHVLQADPFAGIVQAVKECTPDLLVLGPHRREILRDAFVGTTAERTIRSVACPTLMVNGPPIGPYRHILLTTDLSDCSRDALRRFEGLKIGSESRLSVLNVFDVPALHLSMSGTLPADDREEYLGTRRAEALRDLIGFMAGVGGRRAEPVVRQNETTNANDILRAAAGLKASLVVVSTRGKGAIARLLLGSVAEQVLRSSAIDVLAIPPGRPD